MKVRVWIASLALLLLAAQAVQGAAAVERTFNAPVDRVWSATEAVLKHLGWDVDKADRSIGFITTDSRRVDGDNYGVYENALRHRLRLVLKASGEGRTVVSVERTVFKRERILFVDKDEPVNDNSQTVEKAVLDAIGQAL
jgi:uncharacterized protein YndB with AHSA1/START domain